MDFWDLANIANTVNNISKDWNNRNTWNNNNFSKKEKAFTK